jgi:putative colanic acid biosynthesis UDP-glucose lipid carrier transferase
LDILGYVCTPHDEVDLPGVRKVCTIDQLGVAAEGAEWDIVWIALPLRAGDIVARVLASLHANVADVEWLLDERDGNLVSPHMSNSRGYRTLELRTSAQHGAAKALKWFQDYLVALAMLAVAAPIMLAIAVGIMLTSRGPIFYRQHRVGLHGKPFEMLKFRSMPLDTERYTVEWGHSDGKVVTRFGRFIRWTNLDELPQLFNVLRGEMSIVGPRPERPQFVGRFKDQIPGYMQKHHVRPGMTGWAQIHGWRGDTDLMKRIEFDLYYINHWSVGLDLKIVFLTALLPIFKLGRKLPDGGEKSLPR